MNDKEKFEALGRIATTVMRGSLIGRMETLIARNNWEGAAQVAEDAGLQWLAKDLREQSDSRR